MLRWTGVINPPVLSFLPLLQHGSRTLAVTRVRTEDLSDVTRISSPCVCVCEVSLEMKNRPNFLKLPIMVVCTKRMKNRSAVGRGRKRGEQRYRCGGDEILQTETRKREKF